MHQIIFWVYECYGQTDKVFKHEDGTNRDNKIAKEVLKFLASYEVVGNLPPEFREIKPDLELSIATILEKPDKMFTTWIKEANTKARDKGHAILFCEKILPALSKSKFNVNTMEATSDDKAKFVEAWKKENVNSASDTTRRKTIADTLTP